MPLYTYRCIENNHEFQARQRMVDEPLTECPVCNGPVRRIVSSVGVVFKGSGFYVTDNRSSGVNGKGGKSQSQGKEVKESKETKENATAASSSNTAISSSSSSSDSGSSS